MPLHKTYILIKDQPRIGKEAGDYYNHEYSNSIEDLLARGIIEEEIDESKEVNNFKDNIMSQETMQEVTPVSQNDGLKNFIIGKVWAQSQDGSRAGSIKINRSLPAKLVITPGMTLFLTANKKREGKQDADYSVSVLLPKETADRLIAAQNLAEANIKNVEFENQSQAHGQE